MVQLTHREETLKFGASLRRLISAVFLQARRLQPTRATSRYGYLLKYILPYTQMFLRRYCWYSSWLVSQQYRFEYTYISTRIKKFPGRCHQKIAAKIPYQGTRDSLVAWILLKIQNRINDIWSSPLSFLFIEANTRFCRELGWLKNA